MRSVRIQAWYLPVIEFAGLGTTALVVGIGGWMVTEDIVTIGTIAFFVLSLSNLFEPVQQLSPAVQPGAVGRRRPEQAVRAARHAGRRARAARRRRGPARHRRDPGRGRDVRLRRRRAGAARRRPGDQPGRAARAGRADRRRASRRWPSSSPASTTRPTAGSRFGGVDLRDASLASLRARIAVVPQEGFLFNGTIRDNVPHRPGRRDRRRGRRRARGRSACCDRFAGAARGARHRGARARHPAVGRREAARVAGPGRAGRPRGAGARRGHVAASTRAPRRWSSTPSSG